MTYFNPKVYCKQNLKEADRKELEYWKEVFENVIANAESEYAEEENEGTLYKIQREIIEAFCGELRDGLAEEMQNQLVGCIESYDMVKEVEDPETFA